MAGSFSKFISHIEKENRKRKYPKFLKHISTIRGRLLYSFSPFALFLLLYSQIKEQGYSAGYSIIGMVL